MAKKSVASVEAGRLRKIVIGSLLTVARHIYSNFMIKLKLQLNHTLSLMRIPTSVFRDVIIVVAISLQSQKLNLK